MEESVCSHARLTSNTFVSCFRDLCSPGMHMCPSREAGFRMSIRNTPKHNIIGQKNARKDSIANLESQSWVDFAQIKSKLSGFPTWSGNSMLRVRVGDAASEFMWLYLQMIPGQFEIEIQRAQFCPHLHSTYLWFSRHLNKIVMWSILITENSAKYIFSPPE